MHKTMQDITDNDLIEIIKYCFKLTVKHGIEGTISILN